MKILREVLVKERLPNKEGIYFVLESTGSKTTYYYLPGEDNFDWNDITIWFEKVELDLKSDEILPIKDRFNISDPDWAEEAMDCFSGSVQVDKWEQYHKALEAAELEIAELKASKSAVRSNKKYIEQIVLKKFAEDNERLSKDAKERYDEAFKALKQVTFNKIPTESGHKNVIVHTSESVKEALKIASGINDK